MLTTDGSTPAFIAEHGFVDSLVRLALGAGVPPADAYRMVTLNPATYYGRDADLGGIAPGRYADVLLLRDLAEPVPDVVIARGPGRGAGGPPARPRAGAGLVDDLHPEDDALRPRVLDRAGRARAARRSPPHHPTRQRGHHDARGAARSGTGICTPRCSTAGAGGSPRARWPASPPRSTGSRSTLSTDYQVLALGRRTAAMARAVNRLLRLRGGIVLVEGDRVIFELALPVGGSHVDALPDRARAGRAAASSAPRGARPHAFTTPSTRCCS